MSNSNKSVSGSSEVSPWKLGKAVKGMGFVGAPVPKSPIGKSIVEVVGTMNILQYSLGISVGSTRRAFITGVRVSLIALPLSLGHINVSTMSSSLSPWLDPSDLLSTISSSLLGWTVPPDALLVTSSSYVASNRIPLVGILFLISLVARRVCCIEPAGSDVDSTG